MHTYMKISLLTLGFGLYSLNAAAMETTVVTTTTYTLDQCEADPYRIECINVIPEVDYLPNGRFFREDFYRLHFPTHYKNYYHNRGINRGHIKHEGRMGRHR